MGLNWAKELGLLENYPKTFHREKYAIRKY
jgi:hypothetical protein